MWVINHVRLCVLVATLLANGGFVSPVFSAEENEKEQQEIKRLIESLASRNKKPPPQKSLKPIIFPPDFDHDENDKVKAARDALLDKGVAAFPFLIERLGDARYSYTSIDSRIAHHLHVREVCLTIIQTQVEVYDAYVRVINVELEKPKWLPVPIFHEDFWPTGAKGYMQKWWAPRQSMTLSELQREAVEWAVEFEQGRGFIDDEEKALVLGWYEPLQMRLKSSQTPIRVRWNRDFIDENNIKPKESDLNKWAEDWFSQRAR